RRLIAAMSGPDSPPDISPSGIWQSNQSPAPRRGFALQPEGILSGPAAAVATASGRAMPLAGGTLAFGLCEVVTGRGRGLLPVVEARDWAAARGLSGCFDAALHRLTAPRPAFAGLALDRPRIMGIVNVTPDSFSDGGDLADAASAIEHGLKLRAAGAEILD